MANKRIIGPKLFPWQKDIVDAIKNAGPHAQKIFVAKSKRQCGKSFMCEMELLRHSITYSNSTSICVSLTFSSCGKLFKELCDFIKDAPFVESINSSSMEINFKNKSSILFKSAASGDNLRGLTVKGSGILILDECAYLKDDLYGVVLPYVNMYKCNVLMVSTPRTKTGIFYEYFNEGIKNPDGPIQSFDLSKYDTSEVLPEDKIELYRKILPKWQFVSEILGEFVDEVGGVFDLSKNVFKTTELNNNDIFIGIDWATGTDNDYTVVSAFDSSAIQVGIDYQNNLNPTEQIQWISNIIRNKYKDYKVQKIICETNSIGNVYTPLLKEAIGLNYNFDDFTTSNPSKREIIDYMIKRINEETIKFLTDNEQYVELGGYQIEITKSGQITYNGMYGVHDDIVMANAFALSGIHKLESNNNYNLRFGNKTEKKSKYKYAKYH